MQGEADSVEASIPFPEIENGAHESNGEREACDPPSRDVEIEDTLYVTHRALGRRIDEYGIEREAHRQKADDGERF